MVSMPAREPLAAAHDDAPPKNRELVVVRLALESGDHGWGEGSALNRPTYTSEFARQSFRVLTGATDGPALHPHTTPMAWAALANAADDLQWSHRGRAFRSVGGLAGEVRRIPAGAALGLAPLPVLEERAAGLADAGFARIKVKIDAERHEEVVRVVQAAAPGVAIHVDANGSLGAEHGDMLERLVASGVEAIEQPFAPDAIADSAALVARLGVPVVADESVASVGDLERLRDAGALNAVSIKGPRVGGLRAALAMADWCVEHGVLATAGGMLESGLGRAALARLAVHPAFSIAGDVSPARRWLAQDPWPDLIHEGQEIVVPVGGRVAGEPNLALLDALTIDHAEVPGPTFLAAPFTAPS